MENSSKIPTERIDVLDNKLENIDNTLVSLQQSILDLNTRLEEVNTNLTTLINNNYTDLNTKITDLQTRATNLEARRYITTHWKSGTSWYRIWSDGWIEQGGKYTRASSTNWNTTITLFKPYKDTNYNISISSAGLAGDKLGEHGENIENVTTTSFAYYFYTGASGDGTTSFYWVACGY